MFFRGMGQNLKHKNRKMCQDGVQRNRTKFKTQKSKNVNVQKHNLHTGDEAHKRGIHPGFETQGRRHQQSKTGASVALHKGLMSSFF